MSQRIDGLIEHGQFVENMIALMKRSEKIIVIALQEDGDEYIVEQQSFGLEIKEQLNTLASVHNTIANTFPNHN